MKFHIEEIESIDSTSSELFRRLEEGRLVHGLVLCARMQSAGRGRDGRAWLSPLGGLYFSLALRQQPGRMVTWYPLLCALALRGAFPQIPLQIKWPNDLLLSQRKVGGILCEGKNGWIIIGIGVNTQTPIGAFPPESDFASLQEYGVENAAALRVILENIAVYLSLPASEIHEQYRAACSSLGKYVVLRGLGSGTALDITASGELIVDHQGRRVVVATPADVDEKK